MNSNQQHNYILATTDILFPLDFYPEKSLVFFLYIYIYRRNQFAEVQPINCWLIEQYSRKTFVETKHLWTEFAYQLYLVSNILWDG